jgi:hypothetical protein
MASDFRKQPGGGGSPKAAQLLSGSLVVNGGSTGRTFFPPLLPGDQVEELVVELGSNGGQTGSATDPITLAVYATNSRPADNANEPAVGDIVVTPITVPLDVAYVGDVAGFGQILPQVRLRLPILFVPDQTTRYLTLQVTAPATFNWIGFAALRIFRALPQG